MRTYEDAVAFHAEVLSQPMWVDHYRTAIRVLGLMVEREGQTPSVVAEASRLLAQADLFDAQANRFDMSDPKVAQPLARSTVSKVERCATIWVDPDLLHLSEPEEDEDSVNPGLPPLEHLPFGEGAVMLFGEDVVVNHPSKSDVTMNVIGAVWYPVGGYDYVDGVYSRVTKAAMFTVVRTEAGVVELDLSSLWSFASPDAPAPNPGTVSTLLAGPSTVDNGANQSRLIATLLRYLAYGSDDDMEQTSITVADASHDKGAKRAAKKKRVATDVNVIHLNRNRVPTSAKGGEDSGRKGGVRRHVVRGYWRRQPHGPKNSLRKWVYVASFERGNKGEVDTRPKVYVER